MWSLWVWPLTDQTHRLWVRQVQSQYGKSEKYEHATYPFCWLQAPWYRVEPVCCVSLWGEFSWFPTRFWIFLGDQDAKNWIHRLSYHRGQLCSGRSHRQCLRPMRSHRKHLPECSPRKVWLLHSIWIRTRSRTKQDKKGTLFPGVNLWTSHKIRYNREIIFIQFSLYTARLIPSSRSRWVWMNNF